MSMQAKWPQPFCDSDSLKRLQCIHSSRLMLTRVFKSKIHNILVWIVEMASVHYNQVVLSKLVCNCCGVSWLKQVLTKLNSPFSDLPSDKPFESSPSSTDVPQPMFYLCSFDFVLNFHLVFNFCDSFCC